MDHTSDYRLENCTRAHHRQWLKLWSEYLAFYNVGLEDGITDKLWENIRPPEAGMYMRVVMKGDVACGFYIYQFQLSSWCLTPVGYLEDLYVTKCERRRGPGKTILDDFINVAKENGCAQVYWHAVRDNYQARSLYDKYILEDNNVRYTLKIG